MKKRVVLTYGTFDMFHIGHLKLLKRLSKMGDKLIVGVSTDEFNAVKGKKVIIPYKNRAKIVKAIQYVDKVIPECDWEQKAEDIKRYDVDVFAMGHDWEGRFDSLSDLCDVIYLPRTKGVSSTKLKKHLDKIARIDTKDIDRAFKILKRLRNDFQ